jgi:lipopolysaccharide transport system ATP-binding protein
MSNLAIKIEHLSKMYKLGEINNGTLWQDIQTWMAIKRKKEDPHSRIGENKYSGDKDHFWALKDISFDIKQGDRLGIIGKNGAGKSTLLKILSRITTPTEGVIKIKGKIASLLEVGTGFHVELTGRENIYLNGAILGMKKRRIDELLDSIIDFSGIDQHIDTPVKRYSSGMYVRLAFAVAAHLDCDILIADEVLAVGDAEFQKKALGKMQDLSTGQGKTVLFVSHNMRAVEQLCTTGFILENGKLINTPNNIGKVINSYINSGHLKKQYAWYNTGNEFDSDYFKPISFVLTDSNGNILDSHVNNNTGCYIQITGDIKKFHNGLQVGYEIYTKEYFKLYESYTYDAEKEKWPKFVIGINKLRTKLPQRFFNEDDYIIEFVVGIFNQEWWVSSRKNSPTLTLSIRGGLSDSPYFDEKRPTILSPIFQWETINN